MHISNDTQRRQARRAAVLAAAVALLAGCGQGAGVSPARTIQAVNGGASLRPAGKSWLKAPSSGPVLYVSDSQNDFVDVYDLKTKNLVGQITANHPTGLATDQSRNLYVTNLLGGNTTVYPFGQTQSSLTLSDPGGQPDAVAVAANGTVYVADENGKVYAYAAGATQPTSTLSNSAIQSADAVTVDSANNVYVAGFSPASRSVVVKYPKASEPGVNLGLLGVDGPAGIALDRTGRIVLADFELPGIDVFKHGGISPYRAFAKTDSPDRFTFNRAKSRVYVPMSSSDVNIYDYKSGTLISQIVGPSGSVMIGAAIVPAPHN